MPVLDASEIYEFAIRIEENGEKFYRHAGQVCSSDPEVVKIFDMLANEEVQHKKIFQDLLQKAPKSPLPEKFPGEISGYMEAYTQNLIFSKEAGDDPWCAVFDTRSALEFAIRRELDSILYYQEAKGMVGDEEKKLVDRIIDEERKHFMKLTELKKKLGL